MYNVMIVDDEEPVLDSFAFMLEKGTEDFTLCGKARSGKEAIALTAETHPDVIFMDIGMPGIDGLETIRELQKRYPEILFILSTAYERFDIAKKAIPLGVFSYLVKPISRKRFLETLEKVKIYLDEKRISMLNQLKQAQQMVHHTNWEIKNFLSSIPWKHLDQDEWERYKEMFSISGGSAAIYLISISRDCSEEIDADYLDSDVDSVKSSMYSDIISRLSYKYQLFSMEYLGKLMLMIMQDRNSARLLKTVEHTIREVIPENCSFICGAGSFRPFNEFYLSFNEALKPFAEQEGNSARSFQEERMAAEIRKAVGSLKSFQEVLELFTRYMDLFIRDSSLELFKGKLIALFTLLEDDLTHSLGDSGQLIDYVRELEALRTADDCKKWAVRSLRVIVDKSAIYRQEHRPAPLRKAMACIDAQFADSLQLTEVADTCDVSPAYLSRLFSEHVKMSFVDYVTSVRIHKAEELLKQQSKSIKEISFAVGYQDPNYFSRIFKRYTGKTPSAYAENSGRGKGI